MPTRQLSVLRMYVVCAVYATALVLGVVHLGLYFSNQGSHGHGILASAHDAQSPLEVADFAPTIADPAVRVGYVEDEAHLEKRVGSKSVESSPGGSVGQAGAGAGTGAGGSGSTLEPPASNLVPPEDDALSPDATQYERKPPSDIASIKSLTDSPIPSGANSPAVDAEKAPNELSVRLGHYKSYGLQWKQWLMINSQQLPDGAKSVISSAQTPDDSGYLYSNFDWQIDQPLRIALLWLGSQDSSLAELERVGLEEQDWLIHSWGHYRPSTANAQSSASVDAPAYPVTNADFETVVYPGDKTLVAVKTKVPSHPAKDRSDEMDSDSDSGGSAPSDSTASTWFTDAKRVQNPAEQFPPDRPSPDRSPSPKGIPDANMVPVKSASDFWHADWLRACENNPRKAKSLTYIFIPTADRDTIDALKWAVQQRHQQQQHQRNPNAKPERKETSMFPGHLFDADTEIGTLLLGTPAVSDVARLLVQHKDVYGQDRAIWAIRFWSTKVNVEHPYHWKGPGYPMIITLTGADGYQPVVEHAGDETDSEDGKTTSPSEDDGSSVLPASSSQTS